MKIRIERDDIVFEFERRPMPKGRFLALCGLSAAAVYASTVVITARLCGLLGVLAIGLVTILTALIVKGTE